MIAPALNPVNGVNRPRWGAAAVYAAVYQRNVLRGWRERHWWGATRRRPAYPQRPRRPRGWVRAQPGGPASKRAPRPTAAVRLRRRRRGLTFHAFRPPVWQQRRRRRYWVGLWSAGAGRPARPVRTHLRRRTPGRRPRKRRSSDRRRRVNSAALLAAGPRLGYHPWRPVRGRPRPTRWAVTFTAVVNNFWGKLHHPTQGESALAFVSAGHFPGTVGSRRGTPYAAAAVARWAAAGLAAQLPPAPPRPSRWRVPPYELARPLLRGRRRRWYPGYRCRLPRFESRTLYLQRRSPLTKRYPRLWPQIPPKVVVTVRLKRWVRGRRWRTALGAFYTALHTTLGVDYQVRAVHTVGVVRPHNGVRPPKRRRV